MSVDSLNPHMRVIHTINLIVMQSTEVTRMMLGNGLHRRIVASTLCEIRGALQLAQDGILDEV